MEFEIINSGKDSFTLKIYFNDVQNIKFCISIFYLLVERDYWKNEIKIIIL